MTLEGLLMAFGSSRKDCNHASDAIDDWVRNKAALRAAC